MAGEVDDVPALAVFKRLAQAVPGDTILQDPQFDSEAIAPVSRRTKVRNICRSRRRFRGLPAVGRLNRARRRSRSPIAAAGGGASPCTSNTRRAPFSASGLPRACAISSGRSSSGSASAAPEPAR